MGTVLHAAVFNYVHDTVLIPPPFLLFSRRTVFLVPSMLLCVHGKDPLCSPSDGPHPQLPLPPTPTDNATHVIGCASSRPVREFLLGKGPGAGLLNERQLPVFLQAVKATLYPRSTRPERSLPTLTPHPVVDIIQLPVLPLASFIQ